MKNRIAVLMTVAQAIANRAVSYSALALRYNYDARSLVTRLNGRRSRGCYSDSQKPRHLCERESRHRWAMADRFPNGTLRSSSIVVRVK